MSGTLCIIHNSTVLRCALTPLYITNPIKYIAEWTSTDLCQSFAWGMSVEKKNRNLDGRIAHVEDYIFAVAVSYVMMLDTMIKLGVGCGR